MKLSELLKGIVTVEIPYMEITKVSLDSRYIKPGTLFFAINGINQKGSSFIEEAVGKGAVAVVTNDKKVTGIKVPCFYVEDIRGAVSLVASRFYSLQPEKVVAVTGTNGKTSTVYFCTQIFNSLGEKAASIGTLGICDGQGKILIPTSTTTPDAVFLHRTLRDLSRQGFTAVAIEASSHGLDQKRLDNIRFKAAAFTNLTRDHLDYHKTMKSYGNAKKRLFYDLVGKNEVSVLNADSDFFDEIKNNGSNVISYGRNGKAVRLMSATAIANGQMIRVETLGKLYDVVIPLVGEFQAMNALCAAGIAIGCGYPANDVMATLSTLKTPPGRLELAGTLPNGATVYVDYAHTPDALENAIKALRPHTQKELSVLFGCGGDRDPGKREIMGQVAEKYADRVFITDDNPRSEEPETIRQQVLKGCSVKGHNAGNRTDAIRYAIKQLNAGDILLVAGKGHEDYQEIKGVKHPFDDKVEVQKVIKSLFG